MNKFLITEPGAPNSAKFRGGGVAEVTGIDAILPGPIFKRVHFLVFLRKTLKKGLFLR